LRRSLVVAAALFASPAFAADIPVYKAPVYAAAPVPSWIGPYAGVSIGGGFGHDTQGDAVDYSVPVISSDPGCKKKKSCDSYQDPLAQSSFPVSLSGVVGGGQIGYNWAAPFLPGQWIIGLEADVYGSTQNATGTSTFPSWAGFSDQASAKVNALGTVRGRLGYVINNTWMPYVTGGYAWQHIQWAESIINPAGGVTGVNNGSALQSGWTIGGGLDWSLTPAITARLQYLHIDTGTITSVANGTSPINTVHTGLHVTNNLTTLGINYRF
jgi:outer membrane immunogenic protein